MANLLAASSVNARRTTVAFIDCMDFRPEYTLCPQAAAARTRGQAPVLAARVVVVVLAAGLGRALVDQEAVGSGRLHMTGTYQPTRHRLPGIRLLNSPSERIW